MATKKRPKPQATQKLTKGKGSEYFRDKQIVFKYLCKIWKGVEYEVRDRQCRIIGEACTSH